MWAVRWLRFKKLRSNGFAAWVRPCRQLWVNLFQKSTSWKQRPPQNSPLSAAPLRYSQCARHPRNANSGLPGSASCLFLFCSQFHALQVVHNRSDILGCGSEEAFICSRSKRILIWETLDSPQLSAISTTWAHVLTPPLSCQSALLLPGFPAHLGQGLGEKEWSYDLEWKQKDIGEQVWGQGFAPEHTRHMSLNFKVSCSQLN